MGRYRRNLKRWVVVALAALIAVPALAAEPALDFVILRNGKELGWQKVWLQRDGERLNVQVRGEASYKLGSLVLYRYKMQRGETWLDGKLMTFDAWTDDDGKILQVSGRREGDTFRVTGPSGETRIPGDALPANFWNFELTRATRMIDNDDGDVVPIKVTPGEIETVEACGNEVRAQRYQLAGNEVHNLWYDASGRWVRSEFNARDMSKIEIVLRAAAPQYLALSGTHACGQVAEAPANGLR